MNTQVSARLKGLTEKIATELVFAEAGKDFGLLPINSLLGEMESLLGQEEETKAVAEGVQVARAWVAEIFLTTGTLSEPVLKRFGEWVAWMPLVLCACENGSALPRRPDNWQVSSDETRPSLAVESTTAKPEAATRLEEPILVLNLEEDRDLLSEFVNESQEHLQNIEQGVLVLEENPSDADTLNSIFRAFHTFKGGSGFLNLTAIQSLAHELESLLELARQHKLVLTPAVIDVILEGGDTLKKFVSEIGVRLAGQSVSRPVVVPTLKLLRRIQDILTGGSGESLSSILPFATTAEKEPAPSQPHLEPEPMAIVAKVEPMPSPAKTPADTRATPQPHVEPSSGAVITGSAVKVDTVKLDSLVDLVGEMVIARSLVAQNPELSALRNEQLNRDLAQLGRVTRELQRTAMSLRMVPVGVLFRKMARLVRDIAAKVGKQVELVTAGEDTELDRTIVEEISDPLIHMIRNSVDHGIEKPAARQERGKPAQGTVSLKAYHKGGNIVIEISDDGNGLNRDRILAKAIERGLVKSGEQIPDGKIYGLIMEAGFSTAEKVTDLSGRGVGMDVVKRNIEKLRGKLEIQSAPGQGTTFSIYLPLTLAIIDGLLVGVGSQRYILPTLLVRESFRPTREMLSTVHERGEMINVRGRLCPMLRLYSYLGVEPITTDPTQAIVLVVDAGHATRCVMVDKLLGKQEVVIKSLGETFRENHYVAGAAILGDGGVGLILDPQSLVDLGPPRMKAAA
jgi:two-component system chemotaxis sensor kinase CheA